MLRFLLPLVGGIPSGDLASLAPADALVYAEVREPHLLVERLAASLLTQEWPESAEARALEASPQGRGLRYLLRTLSAWAGGSPAEAVARFAGGGVALALAPPPAGDGDRPRVLLLVRASPEDPEAAVRALETAEFLVSWSRPSRLRRLPDGTVSIGDGAFAAAQGTLLVAASHPETLRAAIELAAGGDAPALASREAFAEARAAAPAGADAFLFVDARAIAASRPDGRLYPKGDRDFGRALLLGGILSGTETAPWIAGSFVFGDGEARLSFHTPLERRSLPESVRDSFFGAGAARPGLAPPPRAALVLRLRRDLEALWAARESLGYDGEGLRAASPLLFGGRRLEDELLPQLGPEIEFFACRRTFGEMERPPAVRLPGFALVLRLRDPAAFGPEAVSAFQTAIGLVNVGRGQEGKNGFRLATEAHGGVEIHSASLAAPQGGEDPPPLEASLFPSCALAGDRFLLASDPETLRALLDAGPAPAPREGDVLEIDASNALAILRDNEEALVANDMLVKGRSRAEAETAFRTGLRLLETAAEAAISTRSEEGGWTLTLGLRLR